MSAVEPKEGGPGARQSWSLHHRHASGSCSPAPPIATHAEAGGAGGSGKGEQGPGSRGTAIPTQRPDRERSRDDPRDNKQGARSRDGRSLKPRAQRATVQRVRSVGS